MINIYEPYIAKNQKKYLQDCIKTNQIGQGKYIKQYEDALQNYLHTKHIITTSNGSVSLQLILFALNIGFGDEVITTSLTYAATISSINILGGKAVLVDVDNHLQMNIDQVIPSITKHTKAIMIPQLYGDAANMEKLVNIAKHYNIYLIEDTAEAFGCIQNNKQLGTFGIAGSFSTFANKTLTTYEGGYISTNDDDLEAKLRLLRNQSHIGNFNHNGPGFNARLTNFQCAIGLSQLEEIDKIIAKKKKITAYYRKNLSNKIIKLIPNVDSAEWMPVFFLPAGISYVEFRDKLVDVDVDIRPLFTPVNLMTGFNIDCKVDLSNGEKLYKNGFNLPCYPSLKSKQLRYIIDEVNKIVG